MAAKKPATKPTAAAKKAAPRKAAAKTPTTKKAAAGVAPVETPSKMGAQPVEKPAKRPARRPPGAPPVQKTRVVIPMDVYEPNKDAIKAPLKENGLKWNFLGEGKGLYKMPDGGVHCFTQFRDDGVHYSVWGENETAKKAILAAWRGILGDAGWAKATASGEKATQAEQAQAESEAMRLWKMAEPQPRPGEPEFFFKKRIAEWEAKKPSA